MKSTTEQINDVQYRIKVEIPSDEVNKAFETSFKKVQKEVKMQGFRPGKAPMNMVKRMYKDNVGAEVGEQLVNTSLFNAIDEHKLKPIATPVVEAIDSPKEDTDFNYSAVLDVMPEIKLDGYKGIKVSTESFELTQETVDRELYLLRRNQGTKKKLEGDDAVAKDQSLVLITQSASVDGEELTQFRGEKQELHLGNKEMQPDLEKSILGMKPEEEKETKITLPEDFDDKELAGKEIVFKIKVHDISDLELPELTDDFAKELQIESADKLVETIRGHLEERAEKMRREKLENSLLTKIVEDNPFEVPPAMVDQVIDGMIAEMRWPTEDEYKKSLKNETMRDSIKPMAKRKTQNTLAIWHISEAEKLDITDDEVNSKVEESIGAMGIDDSKKAAQIRANMTARMKENLIFEKTINFLIENADITEIPTKV